MTSQLSMSGHTRSPENRNHRHTDIKWLAKFRQILTIGFWVIMFSSGMRRSQTRNTAKTDIFPDTFSVYYNLHVAKSVTYNYTWEYNQSDMLSFLIFTQYESQSRFGLVTFSNVHKNSFTNFRQQTKGVKFSIHASTK